MTLLHEPWCLTPAQLASLTPWQVEHCYLRPAEERAKAASGEKEVGADGHDWDDLPPRAEFVASMTNAHGGTADHWGNVWEAMRQAREQNG